MNLRLTYVIIIWTGNVKLNVSLLVNYKLLDGMTPEQVKAFNEYFLSCVPEN